MKKVLIIDEDRDLENCIRGSLAPETYELDFATDFTALFSEIVEGKTLESYDLILMDVRPLEANCYDRLTRLRHNAIMPIMILIEDGSDIDRAIGLELGADDCLSKPFDQRELVARVRAVLRRFEQAKYLREHGAVETDFTGAPGNRASATQNMLQVGDIKMDVRSRSVLCKGNKVDLTSVEFNLLECFLRNPGELLSRETLNEKVLSRQLTPFDRSIDVHVSKVRKKLECVTPELERIKAIRGEGYIYTACSGIVSTDENRGS
jgi:two-component system, OmpR family, response regulator CpxR